jgi:hypothetical protein
MTIKFKCPNPECTKALSVKDELAGKKAACPKCKKILTIPRAQPESLGMPANLEDFAHSALADPVEEKQEATTIDFNCPMCDEPVSMAMEVAGKNSPCPHCRRIIKVPVPKTDKGGTWRDQGKNLPSGARRDTEAKPEGAWDAERTYADRAALIHAGVIPTKRKALTTQQKVVRGLIAAAVLLSFVVAGVVVYLSWSSNKEEKLVTRAVEMSATQTKESGAIVNQAAGEYFLRAGKITQARDAFGKSRSLLMETKAEPERDLLLTDLALAQVELGGDDNEVISSRRLKWPDAVTQIGQTVQNLSSSPARAHAIRLLTRKLIEKKQAGLASTLAAKAGSDKAAGGEHWAYEQQELAAIVGLELLSAGQHDSASGVHMVLIGPYAPAADGEEPAAAPPMGPSLVALSVALNKDAPKPAKGKEKDDAESLAIGQAEGYARRGDWDKAREGLENLKPDARFRARVALAAVGSAANPPETTDLAAAAALLGEIRDKAPSPWLLYRLALLAARANQPERAQPFLDALPGNDPLRSRALYELLLLKLAGTKDKADDAQADAVGSKDQPALQGLAREAVARHNARHDANTVKTVEGWDDAMKPFGLVGAALGLQDKSH